MADHPTPEVRREAPPLNESEAQRINRALAEAAALADVRQADELPADGYYIVDGVKMRHDAEGKPVEVKG